MIPKARPAGTARLASDSSSRLILFPGCDPRGTLSRALAPDAPEWSTRPDALVFGWLLSLSPWMNVARAADAVIATVRTTKGRELSLAQRELVRQLEGVGCGRTPRPASCQGTSGG